MLALNGNINRFVATDCHRMTSLAALWPEWDVLVALVLIAVDWWMAVGCYRTVYSHLRHAFDAGQNNS